MVSPADRGVTFSRTDLGGSVVASAANVAATRLATVIAKDGIAVRTIEHLMSALTALGIYAAHIAIDGPEVPIMDGSAAPFWDALSPHVGPGAAVPALHVVRPVVVGAGRAFAALLPGEARSFDVGIDFAAPVIGVQRAIFDLSRDDYAAEIAPARTFGPLKDVHKLRRKGFAKGASLENVIAVDGARVANPEGLRFANEFARHKLLDAIGDLSLAGAPIVGRFRSHRGGHRLNYRLLRAFLADAQNFKIVA